MPWIELVVGLFLILGLWLDIILKMTLLIFLAFIVMVGQAIIRHLPITECGCFGEGLSFPLPVVLMMDSTLLLVTGILLLKKDKVRCFSLDSYF